MSDKFNKNYQYQPKKPLTTKQIEEGIKNGDSRILSRTITLIESSNLNDRKLVYKALGNIPKTKNKSLRIGITGSPGVGKSTFIESFGKHLGLMGIKVAVLAIDPSSNLTGGSILGDKTRMDELSNFPNVFIRPTPSKGELGGVAEQSYETILLCEKAGYEIIIIETVGVGQSETHVKELVDFFLLLMLAGAGDELQGIKRGIMELADAIAITKADSGNEKKAKNAKLNYQNALHLFPKNKNNWIPKVLACSSIENKGIDEIWKTIEEFQQKNEENGWLIENRNKQNLFWFYEKLNQLIKNEFYNKKGIEFEIKNINKKIKTGEIDPFNAASKLFYGNKS
tara:strand:- start:1343 stop:2362 length:1020 start_codon:yes stop_codon:yes gene_type:complete